jgi:hypothetical protein
MKKSKYIRRAIQAEKYQQKLIKSASFSDMVKASVEAAHKKAKKLERQNENNKG